jgi:hypothetical protein
MKMASALRLSKKNTGDNIYDIKMGKDEYRNFVTTISGGGITIKKG